MWCWASKSPPARLSSRPLCTQCCPIVRSSQTDWQLWVPHVPQARQTPGSDLVTQHSSGVLGRVSVVPLLGVGSRGPVVVGSLQPGPTPRGLNCPQHRKPKRAWPRAHSWLGSFAALRLSTPNSGLGPLPGPELPRLF